MSSMRPASCCAVSLARDDQVRVLRIEENELGRPVTKCLSTCLMMWHGRERAAEPACPVGPVDYPEATAPNCVDVRHCEQFQVLGLLHGLKRQRARDEMPRHCLVRCVHALVTAKHAPFLLSATTAVYTSRASSCGVVGFRPRPPARPPNVVMTVATPTSGPMVTGTGPRRRGRHQSVAHSAYVWCADRLLLEISVVLCFAHTRTCAPGPLAMQSTLAQLT